MNISGLKYHLSVIKKQKKNSSTLCNLSGYGRWDLMLTVSIKQNQDMAGLI